MLTLRDRSAVPSGPSDSDSSLAPDLSANRGLCADKRGVWRRGTSRFPCRTRHMAVNGDRISRASEGGEEDLVCGGAARRGGRVVSSAVKTLMSHVGQKTRGYFRIPRPKTLVKPSLEKCRLHLRECERNTLYGGQSTITTISSSFRGFRIRVFLMRFIETTT